MTQKACFVISTVRESSEARMAGLPKTEESKSDKLLKLKEDLVSV